MPKRYEVTLTFDSPYVAAAVKALAFSCPRGPVVTDEKGVLVPLAVTGTAGEVFMLAVLAMHEHMREVRDAD